MVTIGIDPGLSGAVVALGDDGYVEFHDMPVRPWSADGKKKMVCIDGLHTILLKYTQDTRRVAVEKVQAQPRSGKDGVTTMGAASSFNFGYGAGILEAVVFSCYGNRYEFVRPVEWKKAFGLLKTEKDAARILAIELFPHCADALKRKKDSGRADALLIAEYLRRKLCHC